MQHHPDGYVSGIGIVYHLKFVYYFIQINMNRTIQNIVYIIHVIILKIFKSCNLCTYHYSKTSKFGGNNEFQVFFVSNYFFSRVEFKKQSIFSNYLSISHNLQTKKKKN